MNKSKTAKNIIPGDPTHPGEFIKEEIEYRKLSQKEVAHDMKISRSYLNEILNGRKNINNQLAIKFERVLKIGAAFLIRMQQQYEMDCTELKYQDQLKNLATEEVVGVL